MMTLILVLSVALIAFIGLLRYDIHKHKHSAGSNPPDSNSIQHPDADAHQDENKA